VGDPVRRRGFADAYARLDGKAFVVWVSAGFQSGLAWVGAGFQSGREVEQETQHAAPQHSHEQAQIMGKPDRRLQGFAV
jgi:hypothetical protein